MWTATIALHVLCVTEVQTHYTHCGVLYRERFFVLIFLFLSLYLCECLVLHLRRARDPDGKIRKKNEFKFSIKRLPNHILHVKVSRMLHTLLAICVACNSILVFSLLEIFFCTRNEYMRIIFKQNSFSYWWNGCRQKTLLQLLYSCSKDTQITRWHSDAFCWMYFSWPYRMVSRETM